MINQYSISEAKNRLTTIIYEIESGETAQLTRHGKPVAVLLSLKKYNLLKQKNINFWESLTSFRNSVIHGNNQNIDDCFENLRDKSKGRSFSF